MPENALERLLKNNEVEDNKNYSLDEQVESYDDDIFSNMSTQSMDALRSRVTPEITIEEIEEEPTNYFVEQPPVEPTVEERASKPEVIKQEVVEKPKQRKVKKLNKNSQQNAANAFIESLANECIDIMIQQGITIHGFNESQMSVIWDFIRDKMSK